MSVFRSLKSTYVQVIDDTNGNTLVSANTRDAGFEKSSKVEAARQIGKLIAERASAKGIVKVVFDRGGYKYHGRVKELAEGAREGGLNF
jgi:large subunit ribosomal protein L18